jgi:hypothetical protein
MPVLRGCFQEAADRCGNPCGRRVAIRFLSFPRLVTLRLLSVRRQRFLRLTAAVVGVASPPGDFSGMAGGYSLRGGLSRAVLHMEQVNR